MHLKGAPCIFYAYNMVILGILTSCSSMHTNRPLKSYFLKDKYVKLYHYNGVAVVLRYLRYVPSNGRSPLPPVKILKLIIKSTLKNTNLLVLDSLIKNNFLN